jgi:hypothetical protein
MGVDSQAVVENPGAKANAPDPLAYYLSPWQVEIVRGLLSR